MEAPTTTSLQSTAEAEAVEQVETETTTLAPATAESGGGGKGNGSHDVPVQALLPESIAQHKRFSAWSFDFQERFHRDPFNTKEVIEEDTKNFRAWLESDLRTTAEQEEVIKQAFQHPLWKEYCSDCIQCGAESNLYTGGGLSDIEDVSAEVESWHCFLELKRSTKPEEEAKAEEKVTTTTATAPTPLPTPTPTSATAAAADAT